MNTTIKILLLSASSVFIGCSTSSSSEHDSYIKIGMPRSKVEAKLGGRYYALRDTSWYMHEANGASMIVVVTYDKKYHVSEHADDKVIKIESKPRGE